MALMGWQQAQVLLVWISFALGTLGFIGSMVWHLRGGRRQQWDWAERTARSAFVYLQCALWGTIVAFIVMASVFHVDFGGLK